PQSDALARLIQYLHIVMGVGPVQSNGPHWRLSFSRATPGRGGAFSSGWSQHVPPIIDCPRKTARGSTIFLFRSSRGGAKGFPRQALSGRESPCQPSVERAWTNSNI